MWSIAEKDGQCHMKWFNLKEKKMTEGRNSTNLVKPFLQLLRMHIKNHVRNFEYLMKLIKYEHFNSTTRFIIKIQ